MLKNSQHPIIGSRQQSDLQWLRFHERQSKFNTINRRQPPEEEYNYRYADLNEISNDSPNQMQRFTVNWHREKTNVLMMDGMVKSISPKELWRLKWHKNYETSTPLPEWPEWMSSFKEPD